MHSGFWCLFIYPSISLIYPSDYPKQATILPLSLHSWNHPVIYLSTSPSIQPTSQPSTTQQSTSPSTQPSNPCTYLLSIQPLIHLTINHASTHPTAELLTQPSNCTLPNQHGWESPSMIGEKPIYMVWHNLGNIKGVHIRCHQGHRGHKEQKGEGPVREIRAGFTQEEMLKLHLNRQQELTRERWWKGYPGEEEREEQHKTVWWILGAQSLESSKLLG